MHDLKATYTCIFHFDVACSKMKHLNVDTLQLERPAGAAVFFKFSFALLIFDTFATVEPATKFKTHTPGR